MRISRILLVLAIFSFIGQASAQNVFLIQLGSYKSETEADAAWQQLRADKESPVKQLFHQNSIMSLPPSGSKIYRLQAGPFMAREDAASTCNKLAQSGQDCFIVESAAFLPKEPSPVAAEKTEAEPSAGKAAQVDQVEEPSTIQTQTDAQRPNILALKLDEEPAPLSLTEKEPVASSSFFDRFVNAFSSPETPIEEQSATPSDSDPDPLEAKETPASTASSSSDATSPAVLDSPGTAKVKQEDKLAEEEPPFKVVDTAKEESLSTAKKLRKTRSTPKETMSPVTDDSLPWLQKEESITAASTPAEPKSLPKQLPFAIAGKNNQPPAIAPSSIRKELLPPPSLNDKSVAEPYSSAPTPALQKTPRKLTRNDIISPTDSRVEVDEAIPVPLSDIPHQQPAMVETPFGKAPATALKKEPVLSGKRAQGWGATPSRNLMQHSYWVQLSYFNSEQAALNHWQLLRKQMPVITQKMRARVTKPYLNQYTAQRVSLQLGPFLSTQDVNQLCRAASTQKLSCRMSRDIGVSTAAEQPRFRPEDSGVLQRRAIINYRPGVNGNQYWVQLGSYRSKGDASISWDELRDLNPELRSYQPFISQPGLSSSPQPIYRLRTGPFQIRYAAQELCDQLRSRATGCLVISD